MRVAPHEFTSISFPVKVLKIILHDLQSGGESATISARGDVYDVESDDGVGCFFFLGHFWLIILSCIIFRMKIGPKKKN